MSLRQLVIKRDKGKCRLCKRVEDETKLEIHHIKHEQSNFDEIITACNVCHTLIHNIETTLRKGGLSIYSCEHCNGKPRLLQHKFSNGSEIRICSNCLSGDFRVADGSLEGLWIGVEPLQVLKEYLIEDGVNLDSHERNPFINETSDTKPEWYKIMNEVNGNLASKGVKVLFDPFDQSLCKKGEKIW